MQKYVFKRVKRKANLKERMENQRSEQESVAAQALVAISNPAGPSGVPATAWREVSLKANEQIGIIMSQLEESNQRLARNFNQEYGECRPAARVADDSTGSSEQATGSLFK